MGKFIFFLFPLTFCFSRGSNYNADSILNIKGDHEYVVKLKEGVIPDVVESISEDILGLKVSYPDPKVYAFVGNELNPNDTSVEPRIDYYVPDKEKFFTLSMTDPDAPSRQNPKFREWQHWLVVNIPQNHVSKGEYLTEYIGPKPPKGTGLHRYCFLLFEQSEKINFTEPIKKKGDFGGRAKFNSREFIKKYKLGKPVGGNFFQAEYDGSY